ncbi:MULTISPECIES: LPS translocon maturation chaperone LptM [Marinobacter]|uniref:LPS translocon maturation chaperone LptM n=1 Tax=Marinobacter TaxID=2742 RepID=UPI00124543E7|nr:MULTISPECIES: lipoprotein [Marinobacter]MBL3557978.1 lipoprotein [Marinobacter sp. JB05H06]
MKPGQTIIFLLVMAGFIAGCGQKGPLYREAPSGTDTAAEQASDSEQGRDDDAVDR